jgi:hypothetical protein
VNDLERVNQELEYQLRTGKIISHYMVDRHDCTLKMLEIIDKLGRVTWRYFDKQTGMEHLGGI